MITNQEIYNLAYTDVHTGSIPKKDANGNFELNNGLRVILADNEFTKLKTIASEITSLKGQLEKQEATGLNLQSPYKNDLIEHQKEIELLDVKISEAKVEVELLKNDIENEERRLIARGHKIPFESNNKFQKLGSSIKSSGQYFKNAKKWVIAFITIVAVEAFFGLAQFEFLSEYKSNSAIFLRIAASAGLIILLHVAEYLYKEKGAKIFKYYIIYGVISLTIMLFGTLVLNFFFQDSITANDVVTNYDLGSDSNSEPVVNNGNTFISFLIQFDFLPAILALLVFLLMTMLYKGNSETKKEPLSEEEVVFNRWYYTKAKLLDKENELNVLKSERKRLIEVSSVTIIDVKDNLENIISKIENLKKRGRDLTDEMEKIMIALISKIEIYKTDFLDISSDIKPYQQLQTLAWPNQEDLIKFYNLNN